MGENVHSTILGIGGSPNFTEGEEKIYKHLHLERIR